MNYIDKYNEWLNGNFLSIEDARALKNMSQEEIKESFSKDLEFGTAGIRGIMGLGTNRINKYTISKVTKGLSNYLNKKYKDPVVVIAFDTRNNSKDFAILTSNILNSNKIKTFMFDDVASTPELSFAVTYLKASAGIVITSSHNSSDYNGYKIYNSFGSQIVSPEDEYIINEINKINSLDLIIDKESNNDLNTILDDSIRNEFIKENMKVIINNNYIKEYSKYLNITYTSLHGVGMKIVPKIFKDLNVKVKFVIEQCNYDSNFTYAKEPNPELIVNYDLAIKYANNNNSDLILASDPDSDRLGVMIKTPKGYELLNGNIVGAIYTDYILSNTTNLKNKYIVRSIVTSNMIDKIADKYNVKVKEVLTGCKNIANIRNQDKDNYLFGFEESLGYMFNINVNDKNSYSSIISLIEICSFLKSKNISLYEYITYLYKKYGYYYEKNISIYYEGIDGINKMNNIMNELRYKNIENYKKIDYYKNNDYLRTNCIKYIVSEEAYFLIRPSGTEAKIKIYIITNSSSRNKSVKLNDSLEKTIRNLLEVYI